MNEPVKVGQVRLAGGHGPCEIAPDPRGGFMVKTQGGSAYGWQTATIEDAPLLCPAPEDLRAGDVFESGYGATLTVADTRLDWRLVGSGYRDAQDACLRGWRIVARGPEKAKPAGGVLLMGQTDPATNGPRGLAEPIFDADTTVRFDPAKSMRLGLYPDSFGELARASFAGIEFPVCNLSAGAEAAFRNVAAAAKAEMDKVILGQAAPSAPKTNPAPFLPGAWVSPRGCDGIPERDLPAWLVVGAECPDGGRWFIAIQSDYGAERYYRWPGDIIPAPPIARNHAIRRWNRATIEAARETPPRAVTSFGQRKGEAWEHYQRQLAGLLERASGAEPWLIGSGHVADLLREAL